jgi:hypothetical protein
MHRHQCTTAAVPRIDLIAARPFDVDAAARDRDGGLA